MTTRKMTQLADVAKATRRQTSAAAAAQRRRRALQAFLDRLGMTPADLARTLGLSTANLIYNHLHGRSGSLSLPIIESIVDHFDDLTFEELLGRKRSMPAEMATTASFDPTRTLAVTTVAASGVWSAPDASHRGPPATLMMPPLLAPLGAGSFAVLVGAPGAEAAYPTGSLLACRRLQPDEVLVAGIRVIVHRRRDQHVEVTVREVAQQQGSTWLMSLSKRPEHQEALQLPLSRKSTARHQGPDFHVEGVVAWAWIPQPGTDVPTG